MYNIENSSCPTKIKIPSSKSHTLRAILFASLAHGTSYIAEYLPSPDTNAMIRAVTMLGAAVEKTDALLTIRGTNSHFHPAENVIDCGNSGQVLRFIGALAGMIPAYTIFTGDASILHSRPAKPLLDGLHQLGAFATSSRGDGFAPLIIKGPISKNFLSIDGRDSQPVSGLLMLSAFGPHPIEMHVQNAGEKPWIDLTLHWFQKLNIPYAMENHTRYMLQGNARIAPFSYTVPGDLSSALFPIIAALITNSKTTLHNIDLSDIQGDKKAIFLLEKMGAKFTVNAEEKTLTVEENQSLEGIEIDINDCVDALPALAVLGCTAKGKTKIFGGEIARHKESDRIKTIAQELTKMGAKIEEAQDGLTIYESSLHGTTLHSHFDHRIGMSLAIAAMRAKGKSVLLETDCIDKTFPLFHTHFTTMERQ